MKNQEVKIHLPRYTVLANRKVTTLKKDEGLYFVVVKYNGEYMSCVLDTRTKLLSEHKFFSRMIDAVKHFTKRT